MVFPNGLAMRGNPNWRKFKKNTSVSMVQLFGFFTALFLIGMAVAIFYMHTVLMDNTTSHRNDVIPPSHLLSGQLVSHFFRSNEDHGSLHSIDAQCQKEYRRITDDMTHLRVPGLSIDDYDRSVAHVGNRYRIAQVGKKLLQPSSTSPPLTIVVCGGSITLGHGVTPVTSRYSDQLEVWINTAYPRQQPHKVYNRGSHGADVRCE
jgi:hypothetical protein